MTIGNPVLMQCSGLDPPHDEVQWVAWIIPPWARVPEVDDPQHAERECWLCGQQGTTVYGEA